MPILLYNILRDEKKNWYIESKKKGNDFICTEAKRIKSYFPFTVEGEENNTKNKNKK